MVVHTTQYLTKGNWTWLFQTVLLDIINYTKEWGNIVDVFLVFVTMTCNTQTYIKYHSNVDGDIINHKLLKDGAVRTAWINNRDRKQ